MPKVEIACEYCGKKTLKKPSNIKDHNHHFCGYACYHKWFTGENNPKFGVTNRVQVTCESCGNQFYKKLSAIKRTKHDFCSRKCRQAWMVGRRPISEAGKKRIANAKRGDKNPAKRVEVRKKISEKAKLHKGVKNPFYNKKHSTATKARISHSCKGLATGERNAMYSKPSPYSKGCWFVISEDAKIYLRSSYEVRVAQLLLKARIRFEYEPKAFPLQGTGTTYFPDFYLPEYNVWWEVKGWMNPLAKKKLEGFFKQYPEERLRIMFKEDIDLLEKAITLNEGVDPTSLGTNEIN